MFPNLADICILPDTTIKQAIARIDRGGCGIVLVVDAERHLVGTVTDGDIRRAILAQIDIDDPVSKELERKLSSAYPNPVTALLKTDRNELLTLMHHYRLRHIPLLDADNRVADLALLDNLMPDNALPVQAVIMAGGFGTRLRPLTEDLPKPMLKVGDRPVMEYIIGQLQQAGIRRINVTTHYRSEKITDHFGNGEAFGVELNYVNEDRPLGTGGALGLIPKPTGPMLVINGDILTQVDFKAMLAYHRGHHAEMTVAVRIYDMQVPYGVIEMKGHHVSAVQEKPQMRFFVNAGIYLLQPSVFQFIPHRQHFNMTDLIQKLVQKKKTVVSFPVHEYWLDIGQHADYLQAQKDSKTGRLKKWLFLKASG